MNQNFSEKDKKIAILDTPVFYRREFKISLKAIFGFSYIKLRHLNKSFGTNVRRNFFLSELNLHERNMIMFHLPDLALFGSDLMKKISLEQEKFFSLKCYKRNRFLLGYPANGQRTHTNARTARKLRIKF